MCTSADTLTLAYESYRNELVDAGLLLPLGVPGVYARSGLFEEVIDQFERYVLALCHQAATHPVEEVLNGVMELHLRWTR